MRVRWAAASLCSKSLAVCEKGPKNESRLWGERCLSREKKERKRGVRVCVLGG